MSVGLEKPRAHHRRQCQRYDCRDDDADRQRQCELAEHAADEARHEQERDETAISETVSDTTVKPISRAPSRAAFSGFSPFRQSDDVLDHDDRIVDDEAGGDGQRHQREVVDAKPQNAMTPNVPC